MNEGDFRSTEESADRRASGIGGDRACRRRRNVTVLKEHTPVLAEEVLDAAVMHRAALDLFLATQVAEAKRDGVLFSVHLKATMMKVSDPIIFGHAVRAFFPFLFAEHAAELKSVGVDANNGIGALLKAIEDLPDDERQAVQEAIQAAYENGPGIAMVDSDRGITNLHVPSDVIIDASLPAAIRSSGQMWNADGEQQDTKLRHPRPLVRRSVRRDDQRLPRARPRWTPRRWAPPPTSA